LDLAAAMDAIQFFAAELGPREATSAAYARAADAVVRRFSDLGYEVRRQALSVPAGVSWGIRVRSGRTENVIATPPGFDPVRRHLVVGAHLDTVPQAPGAVDNASGVALVLEAARLAAAHPPRLPIVFVAFAAEEPRGPGDDLHHFGSRAYVAAMSAAERRALVGGISIDSVGVARRVPVCTGGRGPRTLANALLARARAARIPAARCVNRTGDHWSFERAGLTGVRIGQAGRTVYEQYHSAADRPSIIDPVALERSGRLLWETIRNLR
jgi:Zn-dependent M28 family amino/carboxypeptidase